MSQESPESAALSSIRVVIVDDTADLRLLLRIVLEGDSGFVVVGEAEDGRAGVDLVRAEQPDLVLLDLAMPIMDGLEALPQMLAVAPSCRVIVLSGFEASSMADAALAAGAAAYLQKGASPEEIIALACDVTGAAAPAAPGSSAESGRLLPRPAEPRREKSEESELEQVRAALATAAHELRSPATVLVGLSQTLARRRGELTEASVNQLLDAIVRQAKVLDRVTTDLLTASQSSRGSAGGIPVDVERMPLAPALTGAVLAIADRAVVQVDCPQDTWVSADRVRVDQMLGNLLSNALKYGQPPVHVTASTAGSEANVSVLDRGPGVPEELRPRLFGQYARAEGLRGGGTGLGLFVVKSLAEAQGGRTWYEPRPGGGSSFSFSLPLAEAETRHD